ncbi:hypothetical protein NL43_07220 [Methanosphaera sp. WGK6]|nr:hypothetical protein NL43_07220 [Methanosphaera sp. WGK6]
MPIISSTYWNVIHGLTVAGVHGDLGGLQAVCNLGCDMAWFLRVKWCGVNVGIELSSLVCDVRTNL